MAWRQALPRLAAATTAPAASLALCEAQRKTDYDLARHQHGKTRVRVLKVRREGGVHAISEYKVETTLFSPAYDRVFRDNRILDMVEQLVGPNVQEFGGKLNMKCAAYGSPVEWHQDWAFYPHTNDDILAVGLAIDDTTIENGAT